MQKMDDRFRKLLRFLARDDPSLSQGERDALLSFCEIGSLERIRIEPPLLLTADDSAKFLGISPDSFAKARKDHPDRLAPVEIHRGHIKWSKAQLVTFTMPPCPTLSTCTKPGPQNGRNEISQMTPWELAQTRSGQGSVSCPS